MGYRKILTSHEIGAKKFQGLIDQLFPYQSAMKEFFLISLGRDFKGNH